MTWAQHTSHAIYGPSVVSDGTLFYWADNPTLSDYEIIQYNPDTDSRTVIGTESTDFNANTDLSFAGTQKTGIVYFSGNLYIAASDSVSGDIEVWKWGGGTTWNKMVGIAGASDFGGISYNNNEMAIIVTDLTNGSWHTTDGTTWSQVDIMNNDLADASVEIRTRTDIELQLVASIDISQVGTDKRIIRFNGTKWIDTGFSGTVGAGHPNGPQYYWEFENPPAGYGWTTDPDYTGFTYPTDDDIEPIPVYNYGASVGAFFTNPNYQTYTLVNDQWVAATSEISFFPQLYFVLDNGDTFVVRSVSSTDKELWKSTEDFPPVVTNARFYQGAGVLTERFTLPFAGVAPNAMTLNAPLGTVVIGSDSTANPGMIFSISPYVTGTATATGLPTGSAFTAVDWI